MSLQSLLLLLLAWVAWCALHSLTAVTQCKTVISSACKLSDTGYRLCYNIFAFVSLAALLLYHTRVESNHLFGGNMVSLLAGGALMLSGLLIMAICMRKYFAAMSGLYNTVDQPLETAALHKLVRHPLYFGTLLFCMAVFLFFPAVKNLVALTVILFYILVGIQVEEKKLLTRFGDDYRRYQQQVPMLIPWPKRQN